MDARGSDGSHVRDLISKRAWEDELVPSQVHGDWPRTSSPPTGPVPYRRLDMLQPAEPEIANNQVDGGLKESASKKLRLGGGGYNVFRLEEPAASSRRTSTPSSTHTQVRRLSQPTPSLPVAETHDTSQMCHRCRKSVADGSPSNQIPGENCAQCMKNPELAWVTQAAAAGLVQLADTLALGMSSTRRGAIRDTGSRRDGSAGCPTVAQYGLKHTLNWILSRIQHANALADYLVKILPPDLHTSLDKGGGITHIAPGSQDANVIMKRHSSSESPKPGDLRDPSSDARLFSRRRSSGFSNQNDELPPMRLLSTHSSLTTPNLAGERPSTMNPPRAPNRQLPSPPGRSLPSPSSLDLPSPSRHSYTALQTIHLPPALTQHHPPVRPSYLPPSITAATPPPPSPSSADAHLHTHASALQHEVSLQKIALSSLQSEHDKLLAAFSRSQTRAAALEKRHAASDNEIITLSEEKLRLQTLVLELEKDVEEMSAARDYARNRAIEEGKQYLEILRRAGDLEAVGRKEWEVRRRDKAALEGNTKVLRGGGDQSEMVAGAINTPPVVDENAGICALENRALPVDTKTISGFSNSVDGSGSGSGTVAPYSLIHGSHDADHDLRIEVQRLRKRCKDVEDVLRALKDQEKAVVEVMQNLDGTRRRIVERAEKVLEEG